MCQNFAKKFKIALSYISIVLLCTLTSLDNNGMQRERMLNTDAENMHCEILRTILIQERYPVDMPQQGKDGFIFSVTLRLISTTCSLYR